MSKKKFNKVAVSGGGSSGRMTEYGNGNRMWRNAEGQLHRLDGPALEGADGFKEWWVDDNRHRLDGPAIERADGYKAWYINGESLFEEEFNKHPDVTEFQRRKVAEHENARRAQEALRREQHLSRLACLDRLSVPRCRK